MHTPLQIGWDRDVCYLTESISCIAKSLQGVDSGLASVLHNYSAVMHSIIMYKGIGETQRPLVTQAGCSF
ncbi:hypothetical protein F9C07_12939 [Aspergillus flavus]|uniref:Uncharacterized protein n=1 Tax=Aspergillus flavus (strain ATCC 200026 / FGSC A1120 / IAM 13836 / NRRL 3357 / JCM 12722 / SRRC 167) TaxID=332952 RepID=A0A7U2N0J4_ASPFN|nr:hypothetical protein F9C07_12939 [Aspergillus flavus]